MHRQLGWEEKEQKAFDELRTKLTRGPVLVYFDGLAPTNIEAEASNMSAPVYYPDNARTGNGDQWHTDPRQCKTPNGTTIYMRRNYWQ